MSTFEQELERVKEIGCPSCGAQGIPFWHTCVVGYAGGTDGLVSIECEACGFPIWKDGDWAPELYAIGI